MPDAANIKLMPPSNGTVGPSGPELPPPCWPGPGLGCACKKVVCDMLSINIATAIIPDLTIFSISLFLMF